MDIMEMGASLLSEKLGVDVDMNQVASALGGLLAGPDGQVDLAGLVSRMSANVDLGGLVSSWLGDGANQAISADSIMAIFGSDKVASFASQLGVDTGTAAGGLADVIPEIVDKSSSGGSLLDVAGGAGGLLGAAKGFVS